MKKRLIISTLMVLLLGTIALAQEFDNWEFSKVIYSRPYVGAGRGNPVHGVAVTPDNCIWVLLYNGNANEPFNCPTGTIIVYNPDGSIKKIITETTIDGVTHPLTYSEVNEPGGIGGSGRGITVGTNGNVYSSQYEVVFVWDYLTMDAILLIVTDETKNDPGDMILRTLSTPVADEDRMIVFSYVNCQDNGVRIYNGDDGSFHSMAVPIGDANLPGLTRDIALSPDGKDMYIGNISTGAAQHYHSDDGVWGDYSFVDRIGNTTLPAQEIHLDQNGKLWISVDAPNARFECWDLETMTIVDAIYSGANVANNTAPTDEELAQGGFSMPRGFWLSPDGQKAYIGDFVAGVTEWVKKPTSDAKEPQAVPEGFALSQNYPNPFNPSTNFSYSLPKTSDVRIAIYDLFGREINTLVNESKEAGTYTISWNGRDNQNRQVATGVYFYKMQAAGFEKTMKMMLVK